MKMMFKKENIFFWEGGRERNRVLELSDHTELEDND